MRRRAAAQYNQATNPNPKKTPRAKCSSHWSDKYFKNQGGPKERKNTQASSTKEKTLAAHADRYTHERGAGEQSTAAFLVPP